MKVFVLEDDPERIKWLQRRLHQYDVTYASSATEVDRFIGPYDLVLLDHDLGGRQLEEHEDNGEAFAEKVKCRIGDATVVVHSLNPDGARRIASIIGARAYLAPFMSPRFTAFIRAMEEIHEQAA